MESVIDVIDKAFEDDLPVNNRVVRPHEERQLLSASRALEHQATVVDAKRRAEEAKRIAKQSRKQFLPEIEHITMDEEACETFVNDDMRRRMGKRWQSLDMCFKWQKIQEYVASADLDATDKARLLSELASLLRTGQLSSVLYDVPNGRVTRLNHGGI